MSDYDFKELNDKEFEILCTDLLSVVEKRKFERFKAGKDGGVDGRFFSDSGKEILLQCKHWAGTNIKQLVKHLETVERPKIERLQPERYLLAVSNPLSRNDKKHIAQTLAPFIKSEADVLGKEDLNDILKTKRQIERRHYKLWLHSTEVLGYVLHNAIHGRSDFSFEQIRENAHKYVVTANHKLALQQLETHGAVIITGDPGVGKTTLADHLCLHYVAQGYQFVQIGDNIAEAESVFTKEEKQIFYFDDFLGRNYLEALKGHEGTRIVQFFRRITANRDSKRFVLTSRSTILNQGKLLIDAFEHRNLQRNEYELRIKSLSKMDKAHILYNHIWHSGLSHEHIEQLYAEKRYRVIIAHSNFNPRLISYITDASRLDNVPPDQYWEYVISSLGNPAHIWDNPFEVQQDDFGKGIVLLVVINGRSIEESQLADAYARFIALPENQTMQGRRNFHTNLRTLVGSLLTRTVSNHGSVDIDLFNPSIGDYVLERYSGDVASIRHAVLSLYTLDSLRTLRNMVVNRLLTEKQSLGICESVLRKVVTENFVGIAIPYLSELCEAVLLSQPDDRANGTNEFLSAALDHLFSNAEGVAINSTFVSAEYAFGEGLVSADVALSVVMANIDDLYQEDDVSAVSSLLAVLPESTDGLEEVKIQVKDHVIEVLSDNLSDFIEVSDAFSEAGYQQYDVARTEIEKLLQAKFDSLGVDVTTADIVTTLKYFRLEYELDRFFEDRDYDGGDHDAPSSLGIDEIDDLFDRG